MKWLLVIFILLGSNLGNAQNFQCLQAGVKHYFTNGNGYLRGIRIDSVKTVGSDFIYYPFLTLRNPYWHGTPLDSNGGSWLGKNVTQTSDGTFLFDNLWHDTVVIKTQAHLGDSWVFYNDSTALYYMANVIGIDTMSVLGVVDSIKKILITANNPSGIVTTDPVDSFQIILSQNNGFVHIFDLYTFPYHKPDTVYYGGFDYYLDYALGNVRSVPTPPNARNSIFMLVSLINPTSVQLNDWHAGDVFENSIFVSGIPSDGSYPYVYAFDSITGRTVTPGGIQLTFSGWEAKMHIRPFDLLSGLFNPSLQRPYDTFSTAGTLNFTNNLLIDTAIMPEEFNQLYIQYYLPNDTTQCLRNAYYHFIASEIHNHSGFTEGNPLSLEYKTGIGQIKYHWDWAGGSPPEVDDNTLLYYVKNGIPCGHYINPYPLNYIEKVNELTKARIDIFPNPATTFITISEQDRITTVAITNLIGQTVYSQEYNADKVQIDVADLPAGVYFIRINGTEVRRFVKE